MKTWKLLTVALLMTGTVASRAWADADATSTPADATATDAVESPDAATEADAATATDAAGSADIAAGTDAASSADATGAADTAGDGTATTSPGDDANGAEKGHGGCTAGTSASSPIALGLAGAVLGWLVSRSRKPVKAPVRNR